MKNDLKSLDNRIGQENEIQNENKVESILNLIKKPFLLTEHSKWQKSKE